MRPGRRAAGLCAVVAACGLVAGACASSSHAASPAVQTAAAAPSTAAPVTTAPEPDACVTGVWMTTSYTLRVPGAMFSGEAGVIVTITANQLSLDFSRMPDASSRGAGTGTFNGQESAGFFPHFTGQTTGTFTLTPQSSDVTFSATSGGYTEQPVKVDAFPPGGASGTWACQDPGTATLTVSGPSGATTFDLKRTS